jgi:Spy/CpxP family protein refolding chaperone
MLRSIILMAILTGSLSAQMPKSMWAWWANAVVTNQLNLAPSQNQQIHRTVRLYRPRLIDIRAEVAKAEIDLEAQFNHEPVDQDKANAAIEHLIAARSDLTRTLAQMGLKLRTLLSEEQWQHLQRLRPTRDPNDTIPTESPIPR